jgi:hypothetical protein
MSSTVMLYQIWNSFEGGSKGWWLAMACWDERGGAGAGLGTSSTLLQPGKGFISPMHVGMHHAPATASCGDRRMILQIMRNVSC